MREDKKRNEKTPPKWYNKTNGLNPRKGTK
jgi:hypothetical protein